MIAAQVLLDGLQAEDFGTLSRLVPGRTPMQARRRTVADRERRFEGIRRVKGSPTLRSRASGSKPVFVVLVGDVPSSTPVRWMDQPQQIG